MSRQNYHEAGIGKSVLRITAWHHEACRVMTNGDPAGRIFLTHPHTINGLQGLEHDHGQTDSRARAQRLSTVHHKVTLSILIGFKYSTA